MNQKNKIKYIFKSSLSKLFILFFQLFTGNKEKMKQKLTII